MLLCRWVLSTSLTCASEAVLASSGSAFDIHHKISRKMIVLYCDIVGAYAGDCCSQYKARQGHPSLHLLPQMSPWSCVWFSYVGNGCQGFAEVSVTALSPLLTFHSSADLPHAAISSPTFQKENGCGGGRRGGHNPLFLSFPILYMMPQFGQFAFGHACEP